MNYPLRLPQPAAVPLPNPAALRLPNPTSTLRPCACPSPRRRVQSSPSWVGMWVGVRIASVPALRRSERTHAARMPAWAK